MTALYLERFMNYGITPEELQSGKPIIGIAQSPNAQPHITVMARHAGVKLEAQVWQAHGYDLPLLVNMQPPDALIKRGISWLPTLGDGRQSGTSDSPSTLNCSPESAVGGKLSWLKTGDIIRVDLDAGRCDGRG